jgi:hypothetical protein
MPASPLPPEPLLLDDEERALLSDELEALAGALPVERRGTYESLRAAVAGRNVPVELLKPLEGVLELILGSGRARHAHRAEGERILKAVYDRTPRGQAIAEELHRTNRALAALAGQRVDSVRAGSSMPGRHTVTITTESLQLTLVVDRDGIRVDSVTI